MPTGNSTGNSPERLRTVCSWCKALIHDGPTDAEGRSSHGMCSACATRERAGAGLPPRHIASPIRGLSCPRGHRLAATGECRSLRQVAPRLYEYVWGDCDEVERSCSEGAA